MTLIPGCQSLYEREVAGKPKFNPSSSGPVIQKRFWERLGQFLDKGDVLLAEQGTAFFGVSTVPLPEYITFVGQPLWGSIGVYPAGTSGHLPGFARTPSHSYNWGRLLPIECSRAIDIDEA
ncbi:hypothetical protein ABNC82_14800 [Paenibacillus larvae]